MNHRFQRRLAPIVSIAVLLPVVAPAVAQQYSLVKVPGVSAPGSVIQFRGIGLANGTTTVPASTNPMINGDNLYAVDLLRHDSGGSSVWRNYYGGWLTSSDQNDKIYLSSSDDLDPTGPWTASQLAISNGSYLHVNDPAVIQHNGQYHMLYTAADFDTHPVHGNYFRDWINYSTSSDGVTWSPNAGSASTEIQLTDPQSLAPGDITSIARPSLAPSDTGWMMWFDARADNQPDSNIHSYLAQSVGPNPTSFQIVKRYDDIFGFPGFHEADVVRRPDGSYLGVVQRFFNELYLAESPDGLDFTLTKILDADHPFFGRVNVSNPGLLYDHVTDRYWGVGFGMNDSPGLDEHDIGFAYSQYTVQVRSPATTPGGQPVWHTFSQAGGLGDQSVNVFNFTQFDLARLINPVTGAVLLEQDFSAASVGEVWQLQVTSTQTATAMGDYNGDGIVNAADYTVWRDAFGGQAPNGSGADGDGDGSIDADDLVVWRENYGKANRSIAVPEPTSLAAALAATAVAVIRGQREAATLDGEPASPPNRDRD